MTVKREKALLTLDMGKIPVNCFDWASHERIVVGTTTGHVAVFDVNDALSRNLSKGERFHQFTPFLLLSLSLRYSECHRDTRCPRVLRHSDICFAAATTGHGRRIYFERGVSSDCNNIAGWKL